MTVSCSGAMVSAIRSGSFVHGTVAGWKPVSVTSTRHAFASGTVRPKRPLSSAKVRAVSAPWTSSARTYARVTLRPALSTTTPEMSAAAARLTVATTSVKVLRSGRRQAAAGRHRRKYGLIGLLPASYAPKKDAPGRPGFLACGATHVRSLPRPAWSSDRPEGRAIVLTAYSGGTAWASHPLRVAAGASVKL